MRAFNCACGARVYFENTRCVRCQASVGFDATTLSMITLDENGFGTSGKLYRNCKNATDYGNCNWLLADSDPDYYCQSCRLNRTIPQLASDVNHNRWHILEKSKRRFLYSVFCIGLPANSKVRGWPDGLAFDFVEDRCGPPGVSDELVSTGHLNGVITINIAEADDILRMEMRRHLDERYRTVLGHFRHESGHYYFNYLVTEQQLPEFRQLFGDERTDYTSALEKYYARPKTQDWQLNHISAYASSHPLEDWAESWAHYLLIKDGLETAETEGLLEAEQNIDAAVDQWITLCLMLNEMAHSMGVDEPYPFIISETVRAKLCFIEEVVARAAAGAAEPGSL